MNKLDVLRRVKEILELGPLEGIYSEHGGYCPFCAIVSTKSHTDFLEGIGTKVEGSPWIEAKRLLSDLAPPYTKEETLKKINSVLKGH